MRRKPERTRFESGQDVKTASRSTRITSTEGLRNLRCFAAVAPPNPPPITTTRAAAAALTLWGSVSAPAALRKSPLEKRLKPRPPASGYCGRRLLLELEDDFLVLAEVDGDLAAVLQAAEQQLVGERPAHRVLYEPRHRARAHERIEAFAGQVILDGLREGRLDLLLRKLLIELHEELLHHAHDGVGVQRAE